MDLHLKKTEKSIINTNINQEPKVEQSPDIINNQTKKALVEIYPLLHERWKVMAISH
jgi:hypothetical protein